MLHAWDLEPDFLFWRRGRSNYGNKSVDVAAPGDDVWSTYIGAAQYTAMTGTSVAVPHVTGTAALLIAQ